MSSLRRDLFERRLWPLAAALVAAIVAVPFLLGGRGTSSAAARADSSAPISANSSSTTTPARAGSAKNSDPQRAPESSGRRNPFVGHTTSDSHVALTKPGAAGAGTTSTVATIQTSTSQLPTSQTSTSQTSTTVPNYPSLTPTPPNHSSTPADVASAATGTKTVTVTTTTPAPVTPGPGVGTSRSWTVHGVDIRVQAPGAGWTVRHGLVRFTPLPAADSPKVMFIGATADGREAVFALGAGVAAQGDATCHPSGDDCVMISVPVDGHETVTWPSPSDLAPRTLRLDVTRIDTTTLHSQASVRAVIADHSPVGLCELQLGDPGTYRYGSDGQLRRIPDPRSACSKSIRKTAVAFPGAGASDDGLSIAGVTDFSATESDTTTNGG